jgi:hypothetical protein
LLYYYVNNSVVVKTRGCKTKTKTRRLKTKTKTGGLKTKTKTKTGGLETKTKTGGLKTETKTGEGGGVPIKTNKQIIKNHQSLMTQDYAAEFD